VRLGLKLSLLSYFLGTADRKFTFTKMFSQKMKAEIVAAINEIRDNAVIMA
jgi:hypothetical protein